MILGRKNNGWTFWTYTTNKVQLGILFHGYFFIKKLLPIDDLKFAQKLKKRQGKNWTLMEVLHIIHLFQEQQLSQPTMKSVQTNPTTNPKQQKQKNLELYQSNIIQAIFGRFPYYPLQTCWCLPAFNRRGSDAALHSLLNQGNGSQPSELMVLVRACAHVMYMQLLLKSQSWIVCLSNKLYKLLLNFTRFLCFYTSV